MLDGGLSSSLGQLAVKMSTWAYQTFLSLHCTESSVIYHGLIPPWAAGEESRAGGSMATVGGRNVEFYRGWVVCPSSPRSLAMHCDTELCSTRLPCQSSCGQEATLAYKLGTVSVGGWGIAK